MISLKPSGKSKISGALGSIPQEAPQIFHRSAEVALDVSLNAQSQAPDIPGVPLRAVSSRYSASLQAQALAPDIHLLSLLAYMEELSTSFNAQDLTPDNFSTHHRFCTPCILYIRQDRHVLARLLTKQDILHFFLQLVSQDNAKELFRHTTIVSYFGVSRIEFQLCCLWIRLVSQGVVCFHSVDFGGYALDSQYAPRFFVDNLRKGSQVLTRLHTKQVISHFFLHLVSQDSAQDLFRRTITPDLGVSCIEFQFCCLLTRVVSKGVVCLHSVGFGGS
jgi:hypothetical protein